MTLNFFARLFFDYCYQRLFSHYFFKRISLTSVYPETTQLFDDVFDKKKDQRESIHTVISVDTVSAGYYRKTDLSFTEAFLQQYGHLPYPQADKNRFLRQNYLLRNTIVRLMTSKLFPNASYHDLVY